MVREAAVGLEEAADGLDREALEDRREHRAGHPVRGVDHDAQRPHGGRVDEGQDLLDEARIDVARLDTCRGLTP